MFVNKYTIIKSKLSGTTEYSLNVPVNQNSGFVGQQEIIDTKFIEVEVDKAVNVIYDYEKVKILPKLELSPFTKFKEVRYQVKFLSSGTYPVTYWSDLGSSPEEKFNPNDFKFKKKAFTKSFLRLDFYDSDIATNQNFVSFITLYPKFSHFDVIGTVAPNIGKGITPDPSTYQIQFTLGDTTVDRTANGEGFSLYYFKDEIPPTILNTPKYLYMKATFNNAKDGKETGLMSTSNPSLSIDDLMKTTKDTFPIVTNNLYTRYILRRDTDGYFYEIDKTYSNNVTTIGSPTNDTYVVTLHQISAI